VRVVIESHWRGERWEGDIPDAKGAEGANRLTTNTGQKPLTDEQLLAALDAALAAAQAELDGLETRRHELEAKVQTLTATRAVYSGQPVPKRRAKRRAKRAATGHASESA
jgi:hypothetical protein